MVSRAPAIKYDRGPFLTGSDFGLNQRPTHGKLPVGSMGRLAACSRSGVRSQIRTDDPIRSC